MPGKAAAGGESWRPTPGKALFYRRGAQTLRLEKPPAAVGVCAPPPGKPYSSVGGAQTLRLEKPPAAVRVCAPPPGKPYSTVEGRKPCAWKSRRRP